MLKSVSKEEFDSFLDTYSNKICKYERVLAENIELKEYTIEGSVVATNVTLKSAESFTDTFSVDDIWLTTSKNTKINLTDLKMSKSYNYFMDLKNEVLRFEDELRIYDNIVLIPNRWDANKEEVTIREKAESRSQMKSRLTARPDEYPFYPNNKDNVVDYDKDHQELLTLISDTEKELNEAKVIIASTPTIEDKLNYVCTHNVKDNIYLDNSNFYKNVVSYLNEKIEEFLSKNKFEYMTILAGTHHSSSNKIAINVIDNSRNTKLSPVCFYVEDKIVKVEKSLLIVLTNIDFQDRLERLHLALEEESEELLTLQKELDGFTNIQKKMGKDKDVKSGIESCYSKIYDVYEKVLYYKELLSDIDTSLEDKSYRLADLLKEQQFLLNFIGELTKTEFTFE